MPRFVFCGSLNVARTKGNVNARSPATGQLISANPDAMLNIMRQAIIIGTVLFIIAGLCGCGALDEEGTTTTSVLTSITVSPSSVKLAKDSGSFKFTATGRDQFGRLMDIIPSWKSSKEAGTVAQSGILTASTEAGTGEVTAYVGTVEGSSKVTITNGTLATITVAPAALPSAIVGSQYTFTATGKDTLNNTVGIYPDWTVSNFIGQIGLKTGIFAADTAGTGVVSATQASIVGQASVTVNAAP